MIAAFAFLKLPKMKSPTDCGDNEYSALTQFKNEEIYETVKKRKDVDKSNWTLVGSFAFQSPRP